MDLYLIRHGQTDYNVEKRFQGQIDVPLNETGRLQAFKLREALCVKSHKIDLVYTSPLARATETARLITSDNSLIHVDTRLTEISLGEFDGRLESDIENEVGEKSYASWRHSNFIQPAPGGESLAEAMLRAKAFLHRLTTLPIQQNLAVVSHQGMLMALKAQISDDISQSALTRYRQKNDEIEIWNIESGAMIQHIEISTA